MLAFSVSRLRHANTLCVPHLVAEGRADHHLSSREGTGKGERHRRRSVGQGPDELGSRTDLESAAAAIGPKRAKEMREELSAEPPICRADTTLKELKNRPRPPEPRRRWTGPHPLL